MKMLLKAILFALFMIPFNGNTAYAADTRVDDHENGIITVHYDRPTDKRVKVSVSSMNTVMYYDMLKGIPIDVPLTAGNGKYEIAVYEQVIFNRYRLISKTPVTLNLIDEGEVYLQSNQIIDWEEDSKPILLAEALTKNAETTDEKIHAVYDYIVENYTYDKQKLENIGDSPYIPNINEIYEKKSGICYDVSSLMASMLRGIGVETKLITGYSPKYAVGYHAWNQVYNDDTEEWMTIDATYDLQMYQAGRTVHMVKPSVDYSIIRYVY